MTDKRDRVAPALKIHTTLLFDLDGVLVDSGASVGRCWQRWATERALPPDKIEELAHGRPARDVVREFAPELILSPKKRLTELQIEDSADVTAIPGAAEVPPASPPRSWAVVTSCPRDLALTRIRRAKLTEPDVLIMADDVKDGKPAPEGYLLAAHKRSECLLLPASYLKTHPSESRPGRGGYERRGALDNISDRSTRRRRSTARLSPQLI